MKTFRGAVAAIAMALLLHSPLPAQDSPLLDKPAPGFSRTTLDGHAVSLSALRGKVVVLAFWATWCAPCQAEMPLFVEWHSRYAAQGFEILGVSMDDDQPPVRQLVKRRNVNYPILMGDEKIGLDYGGVLGLPDTFLIDRQGIVRRRFQGETDPVQLQAAIEALLKNP